MVCSFSHKSSVRSFSELTKPNAGQKMEEKTLSLTFSASFEMFKEIL